MIPTPSQPLNRDSHKGVTAGTISDSAKGLQGAIGAKEAKQPFPVHTVSLLSQQCYPQDFSFSQSMPDC